MSFIIIYFNSFINNFSLIILSTLFIEDIFINIILDFIKMIINILILLVLNIKKLIILDLI